MWILKAIINRAIHQMHAFKFVICHLAPHSFQVAQMFQAQQASTKCSSRSTRPRAMSPGDQALLKGQYDMDKIIVELPKFLLF